MRVGLFSVGRLKAGPEKELAARYIDRFAKAGPAIGLELGKLAEVGESRAGNADTRKREEAAMLEKALVQDHISVVGGLAAAAALAHFRAQARPAAA